ncbi:MAG: ATP-binding cassette domain-containing protein [Candidatus Aminicenantes bacterium]|nr:ATP-binding cassette domain-containing protein [Candidatus Aminicenantes bacterium]
MHALEVKNLSKRFGDVQAVDDASFVVPEGSIFGLIGRNGAGKTTTIRMMMNIYLPDSGEVILRGAKVGQDFRSSVGYLPEERGLYKKMKIIDLLMFFAEIKGKKGDNVKKRALDFLEKFSLTDRQNSKLEDLSKGNQQKVQFIATILHDPEFLVLDEPFTGLDPINIDILKDIILQLKKAGKVIIFSTHLMDFAEKMCDHIAMIDNGKIILSGSLKELKGQHARRNISIKYEGDISFLNDLPMVEKVTDFGNATGVRVKEPGQSQELLKLLVGKGVIVKSFNANEISLQEIFIEHAGSEEKEEKKSEVQYV